MDGCRWMRCGAITLLCKKRRQKEKHVGQQGMISVHVGAPMAGEISQIDIYVRADTMGQRRAQVRADEFGWV